MYSFTDEQVSLKERKETCCCWCWCCSYL